MKNLLFILLLSLAFTSSTFGQIYEADGKGKTFSNGELTNLNLTKANRIGYLPKTNIDQLLNQEGSVGIRVYNIANTRGGSFILACAVKADGFDFPSLYFKSQIRTDVNSISQLGGRRGAEGEVKGLAPNADKFASFFSRDMINATLSVQKGEGGMCFYTAPFESNRLTHIAIFASLNDQKEIVGNLSTAEKGIVSDRSCPNHCVSVSRFSNGTVAGVSITSVPLDPGGLNTSPPYIRFWQ